jgi:hypothetical protein
MNSFGGILFQDFLVPKHAAEKGQQYRRNTPTVTNETHPATSIPVVTPAPASTPKKRTVPSWWLVGQSQKLRHGWSNTSGYPQAKPANLLGRRPQRRTRTGTRRTTS